MHDPRFQRESYIRPCRRSALLLLAAALLAGGVFAQDGPPPSDNHRAPASRPILRKLLERRRGDQPPPQRGPRRTFEMIAGLHEYDVLRISPQDKGPIRDAQERADLLEFAKAHFPRAYQILSGLRDAKKAQFERRIDEFAPRLRHLRRVFDESPELGAIARQLMENFLELQRVQRAWRAAPPQSPAAAALLDELRSRLHRTVELESQALSAKADSLDQHRADAVARRFDELTTKPRPWPPEFGDLIEQIQNAPAGPARSALEDDLRRSLDDFLDEEIALLRDRAAQLLREIDAEVEFRLQRRLQPPDEHRPPPPSEGHPNPPSAGQRPPPPDRPHPPR